ACVVERIDRKLGLRAARNHLVSLKRVFILPGARQNYGLRELGFGHSSWPGRAASSRMRNGIVNRARVMQPPRLIPNQRRANNRRGPERKMYGPPPHAQLLTSTARPASSTTHASTARRMKSLL